MSDEPETTAVAVRQAEPNPLAMIQAAIQQGLDPDKLTKLFELQERHEKAGAARAFAEAITAFQAECPPIVKKREVKKNRDDSRPIYKFANYEDLWEVVGPLLAKHGIAVTFDTVPFEGLLMVTCKLRVGIHVESSAVTLPIPPGGQMTNDTQAFGQAVSYGKRYSLTNGLNLVIVGEDNDAQGAPGRRPQPQQQPQRQQSPPRTADHLPTNGDELHRRLREYDAKLASQRLCGVGALLSRVAQDGAKAGYGDDISRWNGPAIPFAIECVKAFEDELRAPKPAPNPTGNWTLPTIIAKVSAAKPPGTPDKLLNWVAWLKTELPHVVRDFSGVDLDEAVQNAIIVGDDWQYDTLTSDQVASAWIVIATYVVGLAKQKAGAAS